MTVDELNQKFNEANWLVAKRSAFAAGKALIFGTQSLEEATSEIAAIYGLTEEEKNSLMNPSAHEALTGVQNMANGLFGETLGLKGAQAASVARSAIKHGRSAHVVGTLMRAGPKAAAAAATGGKAASNVVGKGTPWGWIATAAYAVGTGGWFAYHARAFNIAAYDLVRVRESIKIVELPDSEGQLISFETIEPAVASISAGASVIRSQAEAAWHGAVDKGSKVADSTSGFFGRLSSRLPKRPTSADSKTDLKNITVSDPAPS